MRTLWIGHMVIGLAAVVGASASLAQDTQVLDRCESTGTGNEAEEPQTHEEMSDGPTIKTWEHMGAFVAEPVGRFWVGPEFVQGEPVYLLRVPVRQGLTTVEVSTTPFMSELSGFGELSGNPDEQPAGW